MKKIILILLCICLKSAFASLGDTILIQGVTTKEFDSKGYISVLDNFNQTKIYHKEWLESVLGTKLDRTPSAVMFEVKISELNKQHDACIKAFKTKTNIEKMCPIKL